MEEVCEGDGAGSMADELELSSYPLHECVFEGDVQEFARLMRTEDLSKKDKHGTFADDHDIVSRPCVPNNLSSVSDFVLVTGNTALHLAIMLGRKGKSQFDSHGVATP